MGSKTCPRDAGGDSARPVRGEPGIYIDGRFARLLSVGGPGPF
ncbi:hypothetical protein HMPREF3293_01694 [Christensenella minuta]|uniref:Uncharacterized protein n=1 Tax=Christensenella minuta TaxID=626937 RepID=A0A136Q4A0_9FIRM|nr:hypothetical protein HMPREF3293_01694 [Christensenella minuta]